MPKWHFDLDCYILIYFDFFLQEKSRREYEEKRSQSMRMLQQLKIGIFEQIEMDWADFSSTKFPLKKYF